LSTKRKQRHYILCSGAFGVAALQREAMHGLFHPAWSAHFINPIVHVNGRPNVCRIIGEFVFFLYALEEFRQFVYGFQLGRRGAVHKGAQTFL
jgi:hypothetical protein